MYNKIKISIHYIYRYWTHFNWKLRKLFLFLLVLKSMYVKKLNKIKTNNYEVEVLTKRKEKPWKNKIKYKELVARTRCYLNS